MIPLEHTYARDVPALSLPWRATPAPAPRLAVLNEPLAVELGLDPDWLRSPAGLAFLTGGGDEVRGHAQAYAGHQFGHYSPRLGDGRALLLGEHVTADGRRVDLHLKGSGRTPFARGGDGYAALGPMLREHLMGEAMHALGIPTTRALAVVETGATVLRETPLPGAVLCRVADSHLRVGTFQYAAATGDRDTLRALADHAIDRHHPAAREAENPALALLDQVAAAQADLVARWMLVGFVHGVMNTDNMTISGQTIDYGPCAFMDAYDPATVFSSIDHGGRYAYGNQPVVAQWNLARLAEALLPLIADRPEDGVEAATEVLHAFVDRCSAAYADGLAAKLGLPAPDAGLQDELPELLAAGGVDWTLFFRRLAEGTAAGLFADPARFDAWAARWASRAPRRPRMAAVNPAVIPRNHPVEDALAAATAGDHAPYARLVRALADPYAERPGEDDLRTPTPGPHVTYCGT